MKITTKLNYKNTNILRERSTNSAILQYSYHHHHHYHHSLLQLNHNSYKDNHTDQDTQITI